MTEENDDVFPLTLREAAQNLSDACGDISASSTAPGALAAYRRARVELQRALRDTED